MDAHQRNSPKAFLDLSLNLEEIYITDGFNEGYNDGLASGKDEGRQVGLKHGFQIGQELGFYRGYIDLWNSAIRVDPTCFSSWIQKSIAMTDGLIRKYLVLDPENEYVDEIMGYLRLKFRSICASLNVKLEYSGYPNRWPRGGRLCSRSYNCGGRSTSAPRKTNRGLVVFTFDLPNSESAAASANTYI